MNLIKTAASAGFLIGLFVSANPMAQTRLELKLPFTEKSEARLQVGKDISVDLIFDAGKITAQYYGGIDQTLDIQLLAEDLLNGQVGLRFADYNMDGYEDFAVDTSYGYGGLVIYSTIFAFDPASGRFFKMLEAPNVEPDAKSGELLSWQKSGPQNFWTYYRFEAGKPYKFKRVVNLGYDLELVEIFDKTGKKTRRLIADLNEQGKNTKPAKRKITVEKAILYSGPDDQSRSRAYLIRGDEIEMLDVKDDNPEWLKISFKGKKQTIIRWIKPESIDGPE